VSNLDNPAWEALMASLRVPPLRLGAPVNDGTWTTPYADWLASVDMSDRARAERARALGFERKNCRICRALADATGLCPLCLAIFNDLPK
jgi:hypothetical protein